MLRRRLLIAGLAFAMALPLRTFAARPLLDYHKLDAYFALYASDSSVPWKPATVRLDTYTSAPVNFAVYSADVADVISAGANTRPRSIDTRRRKPLAQWTYTPSGGYRFESNDVSVPVGSREGFFVVEARRGNVGEQVWINRTRVGLISKETPSGILLYGADLGTGNPLHGMRVSFIAGGKFVDRITDRDGIARWQTTPRPVFALAQWGSSNAFLSFLPQPPLPRVIAGLSTDSAIVHAGDALHVVGFARVRGGSRLRPASGTANVQLRSMHGSLAAQTSVRLDSAGAFEATLHVPPNSDAGDYTVLAAVNGSTAATGVHVDANANGLSLSVAPQCSGYCDPNADVPLVITAHRAGLPAAGEPVSVSVIRSPHAYLEEQSDEWGISPWLSVQGTTGADGRVTFAIPHGSDGLASTYGVRVSSRGATADTRIIVPASSRTIRVHVDRTHIGSGSPAAFDVYANNFSERTPLDRAHVRVQLIHGSSVQQQDLTTDALGHVRGRFTTPEAGSNLIVASLDGGDAMDAAQIQVESQTMQMSGSSAQTVVITPDRTRYAGGDEAHIQAALAGANGSALMTIESSSGIDAHVLGVNNGTVSLTARLNNVAGALSAGAAFVHDGALLWNTIPLTLDAPGRPLTSALELDRRQYGPGALITARISNARDGAGTLIVRMSKGAPTGAALFANAPDLLAVGTTATQDTAVDGASWHPWVDSTGNHPAIQTFARRSAPPDNLTMTQAETQNTYWHVDRHTGDALQVQAPLTPGRYVLSVLKIDDDGRVIAASQDVVVQ